jgi:LysR family transcriptional activator of glutamate synthase operon
MEFRQIQYFIKVAEMEHVSDAAAELHVAQSAVSRQISNLEDELGVKLFFREGRNIRLTPVGRIFLDHVKIAIVELEKAKQEVYEYLNPETGTIRLGFPTSLAAKTLPSVISAFRKEHPQIGFQLRQGTVHELTNAVIQGHIDLAFVSPVPADKKDLKGHILFSEKVMALLPTNHPLSDQSQLRLDQLRHDPFVVFRHGYILRDLITRTCQQVGFTPRIAFEGEDVDTIKGLVSAGLGVSMLPEITLHDLPDRDTVSVEIIEPNVTRTVGIIIPQNRELAPSERIFFKFLKEFYDTLNRFGQ